MTKLTGNLEKINNSVPSKKIKLRLKIQSWKAKYPIFKAIVAGFRGKVA